MNDVFYTKLGNWLLEEGHTKKQLAKELGISYAILNNRINKKSGWTWEKVCTIAEFFECDLQDFYTKPTPNVIQGEAA